MGTETTLESSYSQPCKPSDPAQEPSSALAGRSHPCASLQRQALRRLAHRRPPSLTLPRSRARSFQRWPSLALSAASSSTTPSCAQRPGRRVTPLGVISALVG